MKTTELRIGNFVYGINEYKGTALSICSLHSDNTLRLLVGKESIGCFSTNRIKPILLNEEWLLRFGFKTKVGGRFGNEYHLEKFIIYTSEKGCLCFVWDCFVLDIEFVHDLQNLYFSLKRKELELE
jgi:hypothetical protein